MLAPPAPFCGMVSLKGAFAERKWGLCPFYSPEKWGLLVPSLSSRLSWGWGSTRECLRGWWEALRRLGTHRGAEEPAGMEQAGGLHSCPYPWKPQVGMGCQLVAGALTFKDSFKGQLHVGGIQG